MGFQKIKIKNIPQIQKFKTSVGKKLGAMTSKVSELFDKEAIIWYSESDSETEDVQPKRRMSNALAAWTGSGSRTGSKAKSNLVGKLFRRASKKIEEEIVEDEPAKSVESSIKCHKINKNARPDFDAVTAGPDIGLHTIQVIISAGALPFELSECRIVVHGTTTEELTDSEKFLRHKYVKGQAQRGDVLISINGKPPYFDRLQERPIVCTFLRRQYRTQHEPDIVEELPDSEATEKSELSTARTDKTNKEPESSMTKGSYVTSSEISDSDSDSEAATSVYDIQIDHEYNNYENQQPISKSSRIIPREVKEVPVIYLGSEEYKREIIIVEKDITHKQLSLEIGYNKMVYIRRVGDVAEHLGFREWDIVRTVNGESIKGIRHFQKLMTQRPLNIVICRRTEGTIFKRIPPFGRWTFLYLTEDGCSILKHFEIRETAKLGVIFERREHVTQLEYFDACGMWLGKDGKVAIEHVPGNMIDINFQYSEGKMIKHICWPEREDIPEFPLVNTFPTTYPKFCPILEPAGQMVIQDYWRYEREITIKDL